MVVKGRWGWRPIVLSLFISVFVVGCDLASSPSAIFPTESFRITLTLRQPRAPTVTPASATALAQPPSFEPEFTAETASASSVDLRVTPPRCYSSPSDMAICLGLVENPLPYAVHRVTIRVRVHLANGMGVLEQLTALQQRLLPAESSAPYYVSLPVETTAVVGVDAAVIHAEISAEPLPSLTVEEESYQFRDGRYQLNAVLYNPGPTAVSHVRANVTLLDADGGVAGYRIAYLAERLPAHGRIPIHIEVTPQGGWEHLTPILYVEAQDSDTTP